MVDQAADTAQSSGQPKSEQEKELKARKLVDLVGRKRFHSEYDQEV